MNDKPKILIVDDEEENLINFRILYRKHYDIATCKSAKEALKLIENERFIVIISDHLMPEISGIEFFEIMAQKQPSVARILLSGYVELNVVLDAINRGRVFQYVNKPYDPEFLKTSIDKAIEMTSLKEQNIGLEKDLKKEKQKYQSLFDEASDGILVGIEPGTITEANKKFCEISGYSLSELTGQNISILFSQDELAHKPLRYDLVNKGETVISERNLKRIDGKEVPIEMSTNKQPDGRFQAIVRDITERKEAEKQIREHEERIAFALEASNEGIWEWNLETNQTFYSPKWFEMLGYKPDEFPQQFDTWKELCHPEDLNKAIQSIEEMLLTDGDSFDITFRMKTKSDNLRWINGKGKVKERNSEGKVLRIIGTNTDIHRLKMVEEELRFKNSFEHLFFKISNRFINIPYEDIDHGINSALAELASFANCSYALIFNTFEITDGFNISHASHPDLMGKLFQYPLEYHQHYWLIDQIKNGNYISVTGISAIPEEGEKTRQYFKNAGINSFAMIPMIFKEKINGIVGLASTHEENFWSGENILLLKICSEVFANALESKKKEAQIKRMNENLEQRVTERTRQLQELNDELESFSYSVSHDMRAPLRIAKSYIEIIKEDFSSQLNGDLKNYIEHISENLHHLSKLIENILNFSKLTQQQLSFELISINETIESVFNELRQLENDSRNIVLYNAEPAYITGDKSMMRQVFTNLLSNALKYTRPREKAILKVTVQKSSTETIIKISDNGIGFDMNNKEKIFGVFQRLHDNKTFEGEGVGLAFVQRIINKHNGRIWVESVPEKGSDFYISLPDKPGDDEN